MEDLANFVSFFESLLRPLRWQHTLIMVVPDSIAENVVSIPTPSLMGILDTTKDGQTADFSQMSEVTMTMIIQSIETLTLLVFIMLSMKFRVWL